ncbi:MAG: heavy-metal-associated domain-containing protein [Clostridiales bacterium]|jgi:copper chaperone CopZ|nr:heavy-metal-associated domain-containing protein [Clostridiales bacterium]
MKKTFSLINLDCANCAAKIENALNKIEGMDRAIVSFMTQKMTLEADDARFSEIVEQAKSVVKKMEPDVKVK